MEEQSEPGHEVAGPRTPGWAWLAIAALGISFRLLLDWMGI